MADEHTEIFLGSLDRFQALMTRIMDRYSGGWEAPCGEFVTIRQERSEEQNARYWLVYPRGHYYETSVGIEVPGHIWRGVVAAYETQAEQTDVVFKNGYNLRDLELRRGEPTLGPVPEIVVSSSWGFEEFCDMIIEEMRSVRPAQESTGGEEVELAETETRLLTGDAGTNDDNAKSEEAAVGQDDRQTILGTRPWEQIPEGNNRDIVAWLWQGLTDEQIADKYSGRSASAIGSLLNRLRKKYKEKLYCGRPIVPTRRELREWGLR